MSLSTFDTFSFILLTFVLLGSIISNITGAFSGKSTALLNDFKLL